MLSDWLTIQGKSTLRDTGLASCLIRITGSETSLHHAVVMDHKEMVKILLEVSADIETIDLADHTSIDCAAPPGKDRNNRPGHTPLISAAEA